MLCPNCKKEIDDDSLFCEYCGTRVEKKSKKWLWVGIALVVCILVIVGISNLVESKEQEDLDLLQTKIELSKEIEQTVQEDQTPPPAPEVIEEIEIVEDDKETETVEFTTEDDEKTVQEVVAAPVQIEEEEEDNVVFQVVEKNPEFPGGTKALFEYISGETKYPRIAAESNIQGRVVCQFVVWKDGTIRDITVVSGVDPSLDREAIRVIQSMPKWIPGKQRGKAVNVLYTLPIMFRLQ